MGMLLVATHVDICALTCVLLDVIELDVQGVYFIQSERGKFSDEVSS